MKLTLTAFTFLFSLKAISNCVITTSQGSPAISNRDLIAVTLAQLNSCPKNVFELKKIWQDLGFVIKPSVVANRGRNNPKAGSFSLFETVESSPARRTTFPAKPGEVFFGHFTKVNQGEIILDQGNSANQLMIELIAWDPAKKYFNFYELIGTGHSSQWFYRGDSRDILDDNKMIYLTVQPQFGNKMRCSACHSSGGPIMKELQAPHNDWWTARRPLEFLPNKVSAQVNSWMRTIQPAENFSLAVRMGINQLEASPSYQGLKSSQSLQAQLRPLFCEMEINLASDPSSQGSLVQIPLGSVMNPLFGANNLTISRTQYQTLLGKYKMKFPETQLPDADHAWLTPVKSYSDLLAIQSLMQKGVINLEFVLDVLSVDSQNPLFSKERCQLAQLLPTGGNWMQIFMQRLQASSLPAAKVLLENLTNPSKNAKWYQAQAQTYMQQLQQSISSSGDTLFMNLIKNRAAVFNSEISKNPRGQILEPGFRVIFPMPSR